MKSIGTQEKILLQLTFLILKVGVNQLPNNLAVNMSLWSKQTMLLVSGQLKKHGQLKKKYDLDEL